MLADRLNRLVDEGILERVLYQERPARYEYRLTQKGQICSRHSTRSGSGGTST